MTKKFIVHGRNDQQVDLEFSKPRLGWYKEIVALWDDEETQTQLTMLLSSLQKDSINPKELDNKLIFVKGMPGVINKLLDIGLITLRSNGNHQVFFSHYNSVSMHIVDVDFFRSCFYKNEHSEVINLTDIHLQETKIRFGINHVKDTNLREKFWLLIIVMGAPLSEFLPLHRGHLVIILF